VTVGHELISAKSLTSATSSPRVWQGTTLIHTTTATSRRRVTRSDSGTKTTVENSGSPYETLKPGRDSQQLRAIAEFGPEACEEVVEVSGKQTLNLDQGCVRSYHEGSGDYHADRQSLSWDGKDEKLRLLASLILGHGVCHSKNEAVQVQHAVQAGKVVDHLATSLTSVQAQGIRVRVWDIKCFIAMI
jgi:hypothetical protein